MSFKVSWAKCSFLLCIFLFFHRFAHNFLLKSLQWASSRCSMCLRPNVIQTFGSHCRPSGLFVICFTFVLLPKLFLITRVPTCPSLWVGCHSRVNQVTFFFSLYLLLQHLEGKFFRVLVESEDREYFYDREGNTKFLFYWTKTLLSIRFGLVLPRAPMIWISLACLMNCQEDSLTESCWQFISRPIVG